MTLSNHGFAAIEKSQAFCLKYSTDFSGKGHSIVEFWGVNHYCVTQSSQKKQDICGQAMRVEQLLIIVEQVSNQSPWEIGKTILPYKDLGKGT